MADPPDAQNRFAEADEGRRVVTVLFCDLVGFTELSEHADPEDVQQLLDAYHDAVTRRVKSWGGLVERLVGDGVLAVFGALTAREDDPERAVRAGLAIVEDVRALDVAASRPELRVRVGVNTGEVALDRRRAREGGGNWISGDVVNTASRLQAAADPGSVVVGEPTRSATSLVFDYEDRGAVQVKGKTDPLALFRAVGAELPFGAEVYLDLSIPLAGRELELRQLLNTFERVVHEQAVHMVTLLGEPGVGKTRLVAELMAALPQDVTCREGRVPPYGESTGFSALGEIVKTQAGIYDTDSAEAAVDKLRGVLAPVHDVDRMLAPLLPLVGIDTGSDHTREEGFASWRLFLELMASVGPALVVIEDIHQADVGLRSFLLELVEEPPRVPLMLVVTARPELVWLDRKWGGGLLNASMLSLEPLTENETRALLRSHLKGTPLPADSEQAILDHAEGNPLFTAEFVRMLRDRDLLPQMSGGDVRPFEDVPLPGTVQGVIAERLDLVEGMTREVLQAAAVVGRVFWTGAVAAVCRQEITEVAAQLRRLANLDIVRRVPRSSMAGDSEHVFTHALVRDAAYKLLSRAARVQKHLAAADWLEQRVGAGVEDLAEDLAYHTTTALDLAERVGDAQRAAGARSRLLRYYLAAADTAESVAAWTKALAHVNAACGLAETMPGARAQLPGLYERRARLRRQLGDIAGADRDERTAAEVAAPDQTGAGLAPPATGDGGPDLKSIAVPLGHESHWWERATGNTDPLRRPRAWEVTVSIDLDFYATGVVDAELPTGVRTRWMPLIDGPALVGRGRDAVVDLAVDPADPAVSRRHLLLTRHGAGWSVTQIAEHNPTYLNGEQVLVPGRPVELNDGDFVNLGGWTRVTVRRSSA